MITTYTERPDPEKMIRVRILKARTPMGREFTFKVPTFFISPSKGIFACTDGWDCPICWDALSIVRGSYYGA